MSVKSGWIIKRLGIIFFIALTLALFTPLFTSRVIFHMPDYSPEFDCDDAATLMIQRFDDFGILATPVLGNLKMQGEAWLETDHVWVLADIAGMKIAFDRGVCCLDGQHYEGYLLTRSQLRYFVEQDFAGAASLPADR